MEIKRVWFPCVLAAGVLLGAFGCGGTASSPPPAPANGAKTPPLDPKTGSGTLTAPAGETDKR